MDKKRRALVAILVGAFSFIVYYITLSPSLSSQSDSGELVTALVLPGVAHPPGYPLYTILGFLISHLPFGDPAFRINLFSAFSSSLSVALLFLIGTAIFRSMTVSAATALLFAFSREFWKLSLSAEVFSLNLCLVLLLIYFAVMMREGSSEGGIRTRLYLFSFILGLALSHHHTVLLLLPALIYLLFSEKLPVGSDSKGLPAGSLLFFLAGLLPYLYLPFGAKLHPPLSWGDPGTLDGFIRIVTRAGYGTLSLGTVSGTGWSWHTLLAETLFYAKTLVSQFTPIFFAAGLGGFYLAASARREERKWFYFYLIIFLSYGVLFIGIARFPGQEGFLALLERFFLPSYCAFAIFIGMTLDFIMEKLKGSTRHAFAAVTVIASIIIMLIHFPQADRHRDYMARDYGRNILKGLEENAVLIALGDVPCSSLLYCHYVERRRQDVTIVFEGLLSSPWYGSTLSGSIPGLPAQPSALDTKTLIRELARTGRPVYLNHPVSDPETLLSCQGLAYRILSTGMPCSREECGKIQAMLEKDYEYNGNYEYPSDYFSRELVHMYGLAWLYLSKEWKEAGEPEKSIQCLAGAEKRSCGNPQILFSIGESYGELERWNEAERAYLKCLKGGGIRPEVYLNLAVVYARKGEVEKSKEALKQMKELENKQ